MARARTFTEFCTWLGIQLEPGQRAKVRTAFDGRPVDSDLGERIFGFRGEVSDHVRGIFVDVCGGRSGKSYLSAVRALHLALTVRLDHLAAGEVATVPFVAPDMRLATQPLRYVQGLVSSKPDLRTLVDGKPDAAESLALRLPSGRRISFECLPATRGGSALRGRSLPCALLDEACFFRDESAAVNDVELYKAVAPRIVPGGQLLMVSTPWTETGLVYETWRREHGKPETALVAHSPTSVMRSDPHILAQVERERTRDPENARREFDALFVASGGNMFFDASTLTAAVSADVKLGALPPPGAEVLCGADFGFVKNSSALAIVHRVGDRYTLAELVELRPEGIGPLRPSDVCARFAAVMKRHGASSVMADAHYRESVREHLDAAGISLRPAPEGQAGKAESYAKSKTLFREARVRLPEHERLARQLREVVGKPTSGGGMSIQSPVSPDGSHGDLVSALVLALYQASGHTVAAPTPVRDSPEYEERLIETISRQRAAERSRPWWKVRLAAT